MNIPWKLYWPRARLYPALIALAPAIALVLTFVPWNKLHPSQLVATIGMGVIVYALSEYSRRKGKQLEKGAKDIGPRHTSSMLWHRDGRLHPARKDPIVAFAAAKTNQKRPTREEEEADPAAAEVFYERCVQYLREATRGDELLFSENVSYGFHRNLYGMKPIGLVANCLAVLVASGLAYYGYRTDPNYDLAPFLFVLIVAILHAGVLVTIVKRKAVAAASDAYARQLFSSCELLMADIDGSKAPKAKRETT
jgi:hypothetical protein